MMAADPIRIRLPWVTLIGTPDRPGRWARLRCATAMAVHEVVELVAGTGVAHSMQAARRYAIGAPPPPINPKDWPSKSEVFGTFDTLSDRLDNLDDHVAQGGGYSVRLVVDYPTEDIGWDLENDPAPYVGQQWGSWYYTDQYALIANQRSWPDGIYRFPDNPGIDPLILVTDVESLPLGTTITSEQSDIYGKAGDYRLIEDWWWENRHLRWLGAVQVISVYTGEFDLEGPPEDINGDPLLEVLNSDYPVPVLVNIQNPSYDGIYFATPERFVRSTLLDRNVFSGGVGDIVTAFYGENGDIGTQVPTQWMSAAYNTYNDWVQITSI